MTNYKDTVNLLTSGFTSRNNNNGIMQHIGTVVLTLALVSQAQGASKAKLGLYYESLCPDSQDFFQDQFIRTYESLGQYLDVYFNPFGHATYTQTSEGGWTFECQHGPNECYGNLIQACILDRVQDQDIRSEVYVEDDFDATQYQLKELLCEKYLSDVPECQ
ncbi:hypothetical protein TCAL_07297 [Tigriopus californicus]|uniref:Gamma-interferon-inducible lysosomal thiol reductase n=1 Tax=Tigriopus californicus TaxID=6832 RepID=A0A553PPT6_TIGCA|nr:hypothetical protein TCAL_07297 [Tigriopus californicus]